MRLRSRKYNLAIWGLALGYFIFYAPYSALIKIITNGLRSDGSIPVSGFEVLPAAVAGTAVTMPIIITMMGWWKHAGRRRLFGLNIPSPSRVTLISGICTAVIIGTTTLAFTFRGVSIVFTLVLLRGGVFIIAPIVDAIFKRRVRWFSWVALGLSVGAVMVILTDAGSREMTAIAILNVAAYLTGYLFRLPCMTSIAKSGDTTVTHRYFVEEQIVALPLLVSILAIFALIGTPGPMVELRRGFLGQPGIEVIMASLLVGVLYAGLCVFGTLIYLDRRENTFCVPLNRSSSILAGVFVSYGLAFALGQEPPGASQLAGAGLIVIAILLLSPLHHFRWLRQRVDSTLAERELLAAGAVAGSTEVAWEGAQLLTGPGDSGAQHGSGERDRLFLFVCRANTLRSPMAQQICLDEIASRLGATLEQLEAAGIQVLSAGIAVDEVQRMKPEGERALAQIGLTPQPHRSQPLTLELTQRAEVIYCMTEDQRRAVTDLDPGAAGKTHRLDPDGDLAESLEPGALVGFAERVRTLIRWRLGNEMSFSGYAVG
jgi:protein-tyrosine-phosphatase/drug/metabolite transporter (DMT)-like permease